MYLNVCLMYLSDFSANLSVFHAMSALKCPLFLWEYVSSNTLVACTCELAHPKTSADEIKTLLTGFQLNL